MNETTLYFITLDNEIKHINRDVKGLGYKDVAKNDYRIILDDVECRAIAKRGIISGIGCHGISDFNRD